MSLHPLHDFYQLIQGVRFYEILACAQLPGLCSHLIRRPKTTAYCRDFFEIRLFRQPGEDIESIHAWHFQIENNQGGQWVGGAGSAYGPFPLRYPRLPAVAHENQRARPIGSFNAHFQNHASDFFIFGRQYRRDFFTHAFPFLRATRSSTQKRLPRSGSDSTRSFRPCVQQLCEQSRGRYPVALVFVMSFWKHPEQARLRVFGDADSFISQPRSARIHLPLRTTNARSMARRRHELHRVAGARLEKHCVSNDSLPSTTGKISVDLDVSVVGMKIRVRVQQAAPTSESHGFDRKLLEHGLGELRASLMRLSSRAAPITILSRISLGFRRCAHGRHFVHQQPRNVPIRAKRPHVIATAVEKLWSH